MLATHVAQAIGAGKVVELCGLTWFRTELCAGLKDYTHSVTALVLCLCLRFFIVFFYQWYSASLMPNAIKTQR